MEYALKIDHGADLLAPADAVRSCLLDPANLARCVPGAILAHTDGTSLRGRMRLKLTAVPVEYTVEARLTGPDPSTGDVALNGHAEDRGSGHSTEFRMRVSATGTGPRQTRCRIFGELAEGVGGTSGEGFALTVADRLLPQFVRRLEEVSVELSEREEAGGTGGREESRAQGTRPRARGRPSRRAGRGAGPVSGAAAGGRAVGRRVRAAVLAPWQASDRSIGSRPKQEGPTMQLENTFTVPVPIQEAWELLLDPERVAVCVPGAHLESVDGDEMRGRVRIKLGPMAMLYKGVARFVERDDSAHTVVMEGTGKESSGAGGVKAQMRMSLTEVAEGTRCDVVTDLAITGKAAQFGRGVLADVSGKLIDQFADRLAEEAGGGGASQGGGPGGPQGPAEDEDAIDLLGTVGRKRVALAAVPVVAVVAIGWAVLRRVRDKRAR